VLLLLALLAALLLLPSPWGILLVIGAAIVEVGEIWFWLWWTRRRRPVAGAEALVGAVAVVASPLVPDGQVRVDGELWRAHSDVDAVVGERVVIQAVEPDLSLRVTPETSRDPE
jgi:membrane protein implicated in regulation of membrane protease activity